MNRAVGPDGQPWRWHVALSFASPELPYVRRVDKILRGLGIRCYFYAAEEERSRGLGKFLHEELNDVFGRQSGMVVLFISKAYVERDWTLFESRAALSSEVRMRGIRVLPARFDRSELPGLDSGRKSLRLEGLSPELCATAIAESLLEAGVLGESVLSLPPKKNDEIVVLHLSDLRLAGTDTSREGAESIAEDVAGLSRTGMSPDLVVVSGDLTATGSKPQTDQALGLVQSLMNATSLPSSRVIVVPGESDVSNSLSQAYFLQCDDQGVVPEPPYAPKWSNFVALQQALYGSGADQIFQTHAPWSVFEAPELATVVFGINSTMLVSHLLSEGALTRPQSEALALIASEYEKMGWFRLGVVHHPPFAGDSDATHGLRDADEFESLLGPHLNLLVHGHATAPVVRRTNGGLVGCGLGRASGDALLYQVLTVDEHRLVRRVRRRSTETLRWEDDPTTAAETPVTLELTGVDSTWPSVETGAAGVSQEGPERAVLEVLTPRRSNSVLEALAAVARVRFASAEIRPVVDLSGTRPHLTVQFSEETFARFLVVGAAADDPTETDVSEFASAVVNHYRPMNPHLTAELVYFGQSQASDGLTRFASLRSVKLLSMVEYGGVLDLRNYLLGQSARIERETEYSHDLYLPQRMTQVQRIAGAQAVVTEDAAARIEELMTADQAAFVLVLGDFGKGKSFLLREVARRLAQGDNPAVTPVLVPLGDVEKQLDLITLVGAHLIRHGFARFSPQGFDYMFRHGRLVLLLDGFDELASRISYQRVAEHLRALTSQIQGSAKMVVTSRTQFFRTDAAAHTAFTGRDETVPGYWMTKLDDFTETQISLFLERKYLKANSTTTATDRMDLIRDIPNLIDLAANPRMLSFVADLSDDELRAARRADGSVNAATLYESIIDSWLDHEARRAEHTAFAAFRKNERLDAATRLAVQIWLLGRDVGEEELTTTATEILATMADQVGVSDAELARDLGTANLLVRNEEGRFAFIHASIMEYLAATVAAHSLLDRQSSRDVLALQPMSDVMAGFFVELADLERLVGWVREILDDDENSSVAAQTNALEAQRRKSISLRTGHRLAGSNQAYRDLSEIDLKGADLSRANLTGATLSGNVLDDADLRSAVLADAQLRDVRGTKVYATGADLAGISISSSVLRGAMLRDVNLANAQLKDVDLTDADLRGADLRGARLFNLTLTGAKVERNDWTRAVVAGCPDLRPPDLPGAVFPGRDTACTVVEPARARASALACPADGPADVIACGYGNLILLIELAIPRIVRVLTGHPGLVVAVGFTTQGLLCSGSADGTVLVWAPLEARCLHTIGPVKGGLTTMTVSRDGPVALGRGDGVIELWRFSETEPPDKLAEMSEVGPASAMSFGMVRPHDQGPIRPRLAVAVGNTVNVWDLQFESNPRRHGSFPIGIGEIRTLAFAPTGDYLAVASAQRSVHVWVDLTERSAQPLHILEGHRGAVRAMEFSADGGTLATASDDGRILLWEVANSSAPPLALDAGSSMRAVCLSGDGRSVMGASEDGTVTVWDRITGHRRSRVAGHDRWASAVAFEGPQGKRLFSSAPDGSVRAWDLETGRQSDLIRERAGEIRCLDVSPDGRLLLTGSTDRTARVWRLGDAGRLTTLFGHPEEVTAVAFAPSGSSAVTVSGTCIKRWETSSWSSVGELEHDARVNDVAFSPAGDLLAAACADGRIHIWRPGRKGAPTILLGSSKSVDAIVFTRDGRRLVASSSAEGTVRMWNAHNLSRVGPVRHHFGRVADVSVSPDGRWLASAAADGLLRLWNLADDSESPVAVAGHHGAVLAVAFSPDSNHLASASADGTVRRWVVPALTPLETMLALDRGWVICVPDGRYKIVGLIGSSLWWAIGSVRFADGVLDQWDDDRQQLQPGESFWEGEFNDRP